MILRREGCESLPSNSHVIGTDASSCTNSSCNSSSDSSENDCRYTAPGSYKRSLCFNDSTRSDSSGLDTEGNKHSPLLAKGDHGMALPLVFVVKCRCFGFDIDTDLMSSVSCVLYQLQHFRQRRYLTQLPPSRILPSHLLTSNRSSNS